MTDPHSNRHSLPCTGSARIEDVTRRGMLIGVIAAVMFAACRSPEEQDEVLQAATRTVETPLGPVDVPVFKTLPSVRAGRIVEIESQAVFGTAGLRGQRQILDALVNAFA